MPVGAGSAGTLPPATEQRPRSRGPRRRRPRRASAQPGPRRGRACASASSTPTRRSLSEIAARRDAVPRERRRRAAAGILPTGRLVLSSDPEMRGRTTNVVVVIGTPVDEFLGPSMTIFERTVDQIAPHLRDGALVVLRSTVYPGTTAVRGAAACRAGLRRVDVAFCPERIAEGQRARGARSLPQIIGADDDRRATGPRRSSDGSARRPSGRRRRKPSWRSCSRTPGGT